VGYVAILSMQLLDACMDVCLAKTSNQQESGGDGQQTAVCISRGNRGRGTRIVVVREGGRRPGFRRMRHRMRQCKTALARQRFGGQRNGGWQMVDMSGRRRQGKGRMLSRAENVQGAARVERLNVRTSPELPDIQAHG
jgi:hypothetical protein